MAAPTQKALEAELKKALATLHDTPDEKTAKASVDHCTAMVHVWRLRFLLANLAYDEAVKDDDPKAGAHMARMKDASTQAELWEKCKGVALRDLVNDILLAEREHDEQQDALAESARALR